MAQSNELWHFQTNFDISGQSSRCLHQHQRLLVSLGYQVVVYTDSCEAVAAFQQKTDAFDLVITDMTMPKMTGDNLALELLKIRPDLPIILCTGFSKKISKQTAAEIGVKKVVSKPFVANKMANMVRTVLDEAKRKE